MAIVKIFLDTRLKKENDKYPVKLRVSNAGDKRFFGIEASRINPLLTGNLEKFFYADDSIFSMEKNIFYDVMEAGKGSNRQLKNILLEIERKYQKEADKLKPFTFEAFRKVFREKHSMKDNDVFIQIENKIRILESEERYKTASSYQSTLKSLQKFTNKKKLPFELVSKQFLIKYRNWMEGEGNSDTTTGIYLRSLRAVFNEAISAGITNAYPFRNEQNKSGFKIPQPAGRKLALTTKELKAIFSRELEADDPGRFYVDMWKVMYLMQGINPKIQEYRKRRAEFHPTKNQKCTGYKNRDTY